MLRPIIFALAFLAISANAKVLIQEIISAKQELTTAVQLDNKCTTVADCTLAPVGARACGGPSSYIVYSIKSYNADDIRSLAQRTTTLEHQYNLENLIMSVCSMAPMPQALCDQTNKCVARSTSSPFQPVFLE